MLASGKLDATDRVITSSLLVVESEAMPICQMILTCESKIE